MKRYEYFYTNYNVIYILEKLLVSSWMFILIHVFRLLTRHIQIRSVFISVSILFIIILISILLSWFIMIKTTNRKGSVIYKEKSLVFQQGKRTREIQYEDIEKIHKERIRLLSGGTQIVYWGPIYIQYVITTKTKAFVLRASVSESWQGINWKDVLLKPVKRPVLSIDKIIEELEKRIG